MKIFIPGAGAKVHHIQNFREIPGVDEVIISDIYPWAYGNFVADRTYQLPLFEDPESVTSSAEVFLYVLVVTGLLLLLIKYKFDIVIRFLLVMGILVGTVITFWSVVEIYYPFFRYLKKLRSDYLKVIYTKYDVSIQLLYFFRSKGIPSPSSKAWASASFFAEVTIAMSMPNTFFILSYSISGNMVCS